jgi:hypothetical protein
MENGPRGIATFFRSGAMSFELLLKREGASLCAQRLQKDNDGRF